jgi:hypothetical protein
LREGVCSGIRAIIDFTREIAVAVAATYDFSGVGGQFNSTGAERDRPTPWRQPPLAVERMANSTLNIPAEPPCRQ